jgi:hypothetical protein
VEDVIENVAYTLHPLLIWDRIGWLGIGVYEFDQL